MTMRWRVVEEGRATSSSGLYTKLGLLEAMAFSLNANDDDPGTSSRYIQPVQALSQGTGAGLRSMQLTPCAKPKGKCRFPPPLQRISSLTSPTLQPHRAGFVPYKNGGRGTRQTKNYTYFFEKDPKSTQRNRWQYPRRSQCTSNLIYLIVPEAYRSDETVDLEAPEGLLDSRSLLEGPSVMPGSEKEGRVAVTVAINLPFTEALTYSSLSIACSMWTMVPFSSLRNRISSRTPPSSSMRSLILDLSCISVVTELTARQR